MQLQKGLIVRELCGRNQGRYAVIIDVNGQYCSIADGKTRKLSKPKIKKQKHLFITDVIVSQNETDSDRKLRNVLHDYNYPQEAK